MLAIQVPERTVTLENITMRSGQGGPMRGMTGLDSGTDNTVSAKPVVSWRELRWLLGVGGIAILLAVYLCETFMTVAPPGEGETPSSVLVDIGLFLGLGGILLLGICVLALCGKCGHHLFMRLREK